MSLKLNDWSSLSYKEVQRQLEEYRSNHTIKDKSFESANVKTVDETK